MPFSLFRFKFISKFIYKLFISNYLDYIYPNIMADEADEAILEAFSAK